VVVVGGGLAGLVTAYRLLRAEPATAVTVLDAADRPGGKLRLEPIAGVPVDVGAESVLARRPEVLRLVADLGAAGRLVHPATSAASVWSRGALHSLPEGTLMGIPGVPSAALGLLTAAEVARAADERPAAPVDEDVAVGGYVAARLGSAVVDRLVEPLLGGVYAGRAGQLSLRATVPVAWEAATRGESLATTARAAAATARADASPVFAGLRGGMGTLPQLLVEAVRELGGSVRSRTIVRELRREPDGGWSVVAGPTTAPERLPANGVVLAAPAPAAARLLEPVVPQAARELAGVEYASMAVVTLAVEWSAVASLTGSGFLVPPVEGRTIKASTFTSAKWAWVADLAPDVAFLRSSVGRAGEVADLQREDDELVALAFAEVGEALGRPLPPLVDGHVQRWGGGLPQYAVGHVSRMDRVAASVAPLAGLELAGAAYAGVGIPAVIASAEAAAEAMATHLRRRVPVTRQ
jgi:protoporphyrinogen/coproporphyrinogen III oxidase